MKQYTFSHFLVDEGNRDAFEMARRIADLEPVDELPVILLGEDGCGKTHLLYAIVNRLRAASARTGLAYVTAHDFPEQVRRLIHDPTDVQKAQSAILLVDQLEKIDTLERNSDLLDELEAVVRIFLDNGHYVVIASGVHPDRLRNLTEGLREQIARAQVIPMHSQDPAKRAEIIEQRVRRELAEMIESQRQELSALKAQGPVVASDAEHEELARRLEVAKAFGDSLQRDLAAARDEAAALRRMVTTTTTPEPDTGAELAAVIAEAATLRDERDALRDELGRLHDVVGELEQIDAEKKEILREAESYRQQAKASREEYENSRQQVLQRDVLTKQLEVEISALKAAAAGHVSDREQLAEARAELERLRADAQRASTLESHATELERQLEQARVENDAAREEAGRLLERAEGLLAMVEMNRARFAEVEASQKLQIEELERLIAERTAEAVRAEELESAKAQALAALEQIEQQRAAFEERIHGLEVALAESQAEADGIRDAHDRTISDRERLEAEREGERVRWEQEAEAQRTELVRAWEAERSAFQSELSALRTKSVALGDERDGLRGRLSELEREFDGLRHEAAQQVAAAHAQAGELEGRLGRMETAFETLRRAADKVSAELLDFATEMRSGAGELVGVAERLSFEAESPLVKVKNETVSPSLGGPVSVDERSGLLNVVQRVDDEHDDTTDDGRAFDDFPSGSVPTNGHGLTGDSKADLVPELDDALDEAHVPGGPHTDDYSGAQRHD